MVGRSEDCSLDTGIAAGGLLGTGRCLMGKGGAFAGSFATPDDVGVGGATARFEGTSIFFDSCVQFVFIGQCVESVIDYYPA